MLTVIVASVSVLLLVSAHVKGRRLPVVAPLLDKLLGIPSTSTPLPSPDLPAAPTTATKGDLDITLAELKAHVQVIEAELAALLLKAKSGVHAAVEKLK